MNQGMLFVWETKESLREMLSKETDVSKLKRLQLLYLLSTRQVTTRKSASQVLGVHRQTIGRWLKDYESGGLKRLLTIRHSPGISSSLPPAIMQAMREKLTNSTGVASFKELQQWVERSFKIETSYRVIHYTASQVLKARLAVGRRSHLKKKKVTRQLFEKVLKLVCVAPLNRRALFIGAHRWCCPNLKLSTRTYQ